jgi:hypothetical protein
MDMLTFESQGVILRNDESAHSVEKECGLVLPWWDFAALVAHNVPYVLRATLNHFCGLINTRSYPGRLARLWRQPTDAYYVNRRVAILWEAIRWHPR